MDASRMSGAAYAGGVALLAALYLLVAHLGLQLAHYHNNVTLIWPPSGLALAALILFGLRMWPGVFLGVLTLTLSRGDPVLVGFGMAAGNTLEAVVGAFLLVRVADFHPSLERVQDVIAFLALGVFTASLVGATGGASSLWLAGQLAPGDFGMIWLLWWLGDAGGALVVAPLLLLGRHGSPPWRVLAARIEAWLVLGLVAAAGLVAFGGIATGAWALFSVFLPFPFLAWAGGRLGPRGAVTAALTISLLATIGTARGFGAFVVEGTHQGMLLLWAYAVTVGWTGLILAAAITQREHAERRWRSGEAERLRIERRMHEAQRLEALGLLAGGIAHDFNNVLTVIRGNAVLLAERLAEDEPAGARVRRIEAASNRAADLCHRLLAYAGRESPTKEAVRLPRLFDETRALVRTFIPRTVSLEMAVSPDAPAVEGDPTQLQQVVMNLVLNAAEAVGEARGRIVVVAGRKTLGPDELAELSVAGAASPGTFGMVEVRDTGGGMDADTLKRIFDPFFSTKLEARGLGLASVLGIVRAHGGAIDVRSTPGEGSRFRVYVPAALSESGRAPQPAHSDSPRGEGRLVLLAEDEPDVREIAVTVLEAAGYRVLPVDDGRAAVDAFRERRNEIDAVLLDVGMPELGGVEVLAAIRALDPDTPVVLMSGHEAKAAHHGPAPDSFLRKPFSNEALVEELGRALR